MTSGGISAPSTCLLKKLLIITFCDFCGRMETVVNSSSHKKQNDKKAVRKSEKKRECVDNRRVRVTNPLEGVYSHKNLSRT